MSAYQNTSFQFLPVPALEFLYYIPLANQNEALREALYHCVLKKAVLLTNQNQGFVYAFKRRLIEKGNRGAC